MFPFHRPSILSVELTELPERSFITRSTRLKCRWIFAIVMLGPLAVLAGSLLEHASNADTQPKPYQTQRGSLTVQRKEVDSNQPRDPVAPTQLVAVKTPPPQAQPRDENSTEQARIASESRPRPSTTTIAPTPEQAAPVSQEVEQLLTELAEGVGNGQKETDGENGPAYVLSSMESYQRLLKEARGVIIALNMKTELSFQLGSSLTPKQWKESPLTSWRNLPNYSKRVTPLPTADPAVAALRARFLSEHPDWEARQTRLMLAIPQSLDDTILQAQLAACDRHRIRPSSRVVTIGDLVPQPNGVTYVVRAVKDFSSRDRVAAR